MRPPDDAPAKTFSGATAPARLTLDLVVVGVLLVLAGFALVVVSMLSRSGGAETSVKGGGVVMIGPIPIIFGTDAKWASVAIVLAIILILLYFLLWVV